MIRFFSQFDTIVQTSCEHTQFTQHQFYLFFHRQMIIWTINTGKTTSLLVKFLLPLHRLSFPPWHWKCIAFLCSHMTGSGSIGSHQDIQSYFKFALDREIKFKSLWKIFRKLFCISIKWHIHVDKITIYDIGILWLTDIYIYFIALNLIHPLYACMNVC